MNSFNVITTENLNYRERCVLWDYLNNLAGGDYHNTTHYACVGLGFNPYFQVGKDYQDYPRHVVMDTAVKPYTDVHTTRVLMDDQIHERAEIEKATKLYDRYSRQLKSQRVKNAKLMDTVKLLQNKLFRLKEVSRVSDELTYDYQLKELEAALPMGSDKSVLLTCFQIYLLSRKYGVRTYYATFGQTAAGEHSSSKDRAYDFYAHHPMLVVLSGTQIIDNGYGCSRLVFDLEERQCLIDAPADVSYNADNLAYQRELMR
jgi:hypothetical protein